MSEKEYFVTLRAFKFFCDFGGEMLPTGMVLTVFPPLYVHECEKCKVRQNLRHSYPRIVEELTEKT